MQQIIEFFESLFLLYIIFLPVFILATENRYLLSARLPRIIPLLRILLLNPYNEFQRIANKSYYSKFYEFSYNSQGGPGYAEWFEKEHDWGYSRRIGRRRTLVLANRILEFRIWLMLKSCQNYDQLLCKAILIMIKVSDSGFVFVSSPLYAHKKGIRAGLGSLRKAIIDTAESDSDNGLVFNQIPFLNRSLPKLNKDVRNKFEEFYKPLIASLPISKVVMNGDWQNSEGCKTEHDVAVEFGKNVLYQ